jgi:hypothetical protein
MPADMAMLGNSLPDTLSTKNLGFNSGNPLCYRTIHSFKVTVREGIGLNLKTGGEIRLGQATESPPFPRYTVKHG